MDKKQEIENLIKEKLNISEINRNATIADYGLDSLDVVEFLLELEEQYGISFEASETTNLKTIGELLDLLDKKIK